MENCYNRRNSRQCAKTIVMTSLSVNVSQTEAPTHESINGITTLQSVTERHV
jgi:hypothetical protein